MPTRVAVAEDVAAECGGEQVDNFVGAADRVQQPAGFGPAGILALLALLALPPTGRDAECLAERLAVQPPDVLSTLADDPVIARRDQATPAADLLHARLCDRQADLAADRQAEHLVGDVFGVFAGLGLDHVRARQTGVGPGPAPAALVVDEGELVALPGQREAHPPLAIRTGESRRGSLHEVSQLVLAQPGGRVAVARPRQVPRRQEGRRAGAVLAQLGQQQVAIGGVDVQLPPQAVAARTFGQQSLDVRSGDLGAVGLRPGKALLSNSLPARPD